MRLFSQPKSIMTPPAVTLKNLGLQNKQATHPVQPGIYSGPNSMNMLSRYTQRMPAGSGINMYVA